MTAPQARPLPCPFCGAEMVERTGGWWSHPRGEPCFADTFSLHGPEYEEAWNRRAAGRASRETVERAARALYAKACIDTPPISGVIVPFEQLFKAKGYYTELTETALTAAGFEIEEA